MDFRNKITTYLAAALAVAAMSACSSDKAGGEVSNFDLLMGSDSIPQSVKDVVKAVNDNDAEAFATVTGYPLQRPYPLKDIADAEQMKAYYPVIVDDSLRNAIILSTPADWQEYGWRGYSLKDGEYLWIDETVYDIGYVSRREKELIDSLTNVELNSLPEQLREEVKPVITLLDKKNGTAYRIDEYIPHKAQEYRLSVYDPQGDPQKLREMPALTLDGFIRVEGSTPVVSYVFPIKTGGEYVIYTDDTSAGTPVAILPDGTETALEKAYWYELIRE